MALLVEVTQEMRDFAFASYRQIKIKIPNASESWYVGYLGEAVFKSLLDDQEIKYRYVPRYDGKSDFGDFYITHRGRGYKTDVKTTQDGQWLLVDKTRVKDAELFIGIRLQKDTAEVFGVCARGDLRDPDPQMKQSHCKGILLSQLMPIEDMFNNLR